MDAFLVLVFVIIIICWSCYRRKLSKAAYGIAALDMLLQIVNFISRNIGIKAIANFFAPWPNGILAVAGHYTSGMVYLLIAWAFVILMIYFLFLILTVFFKK